MREFVDFEKLSEGELFFANGMIHCKTMDGIFRLPSQSVRADDNASTFLATKVYGHILIPKEWFKSMTK